MSYSTASRAIHQYSRVRTHGGVESANPHQLTAMLLDGALGRIASARGHMERGEIAAKGESISRSMDIIEGLRGSLDLARGGELAGRLESLYQYMNRRLLEANGHVFGIHVGAEIRNREVGATKYIRKGSGRTPRSLARRNSGSASKPCCSR